MKTKKSKSPKPPQKKPIRIYTFAEFQAEVETAKQNVEAVWSPRHATSLGERLGTINSYIPPDPTPETVLSREASSAIDLMRKWAAKLPIK